MTQTDLSFSQTPPPNPCKVGTHAWAMMQALIRFEAHVHPVYRNDVIDFAKEIVQGAALKPVDPEAETLGRQLRAHRNHPTLVDKLAGTGWDIYCANGKVELRRE
jgi:hypothetical protein